MNKEIKLKDPKKLNELIVKSGYSYRGLARAIKCSQTQISLIANQTRNPSPNTAIKLCKALNTNFDSIFFIQSDYNSNQESEVK